MVHTNVSTNMKLICAKMQINKDKYPKRGYNTTVIHNTRNILKKVTFLWYFVCAAADVYKFIEFCRYFLLASLDN